MRKFFSFPWASCIDLFLPPCFSFSDEGEENAPDKSGKRMTFGIAKEDKEKDPVAAGK